MSNDLRTQFRAAYRQQNPDAADLSDAELDRLYDESLEKLRKAGIDLEADLEAQNSAPENPSSGADSVQARVVKAVAIIAFSTVLRWGYVAAATYWLNRVRHLFGREEKFRVRDMYMVMLALRGLARPLTETAVGTTRSENMLYAEFEKVLKG